MTQPKAVVRPQSKCNARKLRQHQRNAESNQKRQQEYQAWADKQRLNQPIRQSAPQKPRKKYRAPRQVEIDPDSAYGQQISRLERFAKQFSQARKFEVRIKLLQEMAELKFATIQAKFRPLIRAEFDENKRKWMQLKGVCAVCYCRPDVRHHIVQIQNGGLNHRKNLMLLCNLCHAEVHPWLKL